MNRFTNSEVKEIMETQVRPRVQIMNRLRNEAPINREPTEEEDQELWGYITGIQSWLKHVSLDRVYKAYGETANYHPKVTEILGGDGDSDITHKLYYMNEFRDKIYRSNPDISDKIIRINDQQYNALDFIEDILFSFKQGELNKEEVSTQLAIVKLIDEEDKEPIENFLKQIDRYEHHNRNTNTIVNGGKRKTRRSKRKSRTIKLKSLRNR